MCKDNDKSKTNLEGNVLGSGSTLMSVQTLVQTFGLCTRVWTDTRVDTSPCTPLSVGLVYVMHEIYTDFTLLLPEFYQRNLLGECISILTLCPPNTGKTNDTVFDMV